MVHVNTNMIGAIELKRCDKDQALFRKVNSYLVFVPYPSQSATDDIKTSKRGSPKII